MKLTCTQGAHLDLSFVDRKGNPVAAAADSPPSWSSSDPSVLAVTGVSPDGLGAQVVAEGPLGTGQIIVSWTMGGQPGTCSEGFEVGPGAVAGGVIVAGVPTEQ